MSWKLFRGVGTLLAATAIVFSLTTKAYNHVPPGSAPVDYMSVQFKNFALTVDVPNVGPIIGQTDVTVEHPWWISNRPRNEAARDSQDPTNIAAAWLHEIHQNIRREDGSPFPGVADGVTIHTEWECVSPATLASLFEDGYAIINSSGGFVFRMKSQQILDGDGNELPSIDLDGFEARSINTPGTGDSGDFIKADETFQGICG